MKLRIAIGAAGILLGLFGVFRLLTQVNTASLIQVGIWLGAALILHDGVLAPVIVGVGALLAKLPSRARGVLQGALITGALVTVIALPLIDRAYTLPDSKAILQQNYAANLGVLLTVIAGGAIVLYLVRLLRTRPRRPRPGPGRAGPLPGGGAQKPVGK